MTPEEAKQRIDEIISRSKADVKVLLNDLCIASMKGDAQYSMLFCCV